MRRYFSTRPLFSFVLQTGVKWLVVLREVPVAERICDLGIMGRQVSLNDDTRSDLRHAD